MLYTTPEAVLSRFDGRLSYFTKPVLGNQSVDSGLVDQLIEQWSEWLELHLRNLYQLPLVGEHSLLAEYVEHAVGCELYSIYYQGQDVNDDRGARFHSCDRAEKILETLVSGIVSLPGEVRVSDASPAVSTSETIVRQFKPSVAESIEWS